jgi:hypothetical protein
MELDTDLDTLERAINELCPHPIEVRRETIGTRVYLCVSTDQFGDQRLLRIEAALGYRLYWSSFHTPIDHDDDGDGDRRGDLDFILRAVTGFVIEGRRWQELPELAG